MKKIDEIENYFHKNGIPKAECQLDVCTIISDPEKFVKNHIGTLRGNPAKARFLPYFDRLNKFYERCLKSQVEKNSK